MNSKNSKSGLFLKIAGGAIIGAKFALGILEYFDTKSFESFSGAVTALIIFAVLYPGFKAVSGSPEKPKGAVKTMLILTAAGGFLLILAAVYLARKASLMAAAPTVCFIILVYGTSRYYKNNSSAMVEEETEKEAEERKEAEKNMAKSEKIARYIIAIFCIAVPAYCAAVVVVSLIKHGGESLTAIHMSLDLLFTLVCIGILLKPSITLGDPDKKGNSAA